MNSSLRRTTGREYLEASRAVRGGCFKSAGVRVRRGAVRPLIGSTSQSGRSLSNSSLLTRRSDWQASPVGTRSLPTRGYTTSTGTPLNDDDDGIRRPTRSLKGRVAIVTGAGAAGDGIGNGRAAAILLAEAGCSVICVDLHNDLAQRTADMINAEGKGSAIALSGNVIDPEDCERICDTAVSEFGRLDILVNNVGIMGPKGNAVQVKIGDFIKGLEVNIASMVLMAKYSIPKMSNNSGQWAGSIVNMGSVAGLLGGTPNLLYPTSKGAVVNMTRAMASNHAVDRIRANCVCPGMVYTPMVFATSGMAGAEREARKARSLLGTEGNAWDVGAAIRFLAGDEARWMTGVNLPVDAGTTAATGIGSKSLYTSNTLKTS